MRDRKQKGQILHIGDHWFVRYWERRNIGGNIKRKRVTQELGAVTTRGKTPPTEIKTAAEKFMTSLQGSDIPPENVVTIGDFVERVYLPWVGMHNSTQNGCAGVSGKCEYLPRGSI